MRGDTWLLLLVSSIGLVLIVNSSVSLAVFYRQRSTWSYYSLVFGPFPLVYFVALLLEEFARMRLFPYWWRFPHEETIAIMSLGVAVSLLVNCWFLFRPGPARGQLRRNEVVNAFVLFFAVVTGIAYWVAWTPSYRHGGFLSPGAIWFMIGTSMFGILANLYLCHLKRVSIIWGCLGVIPFVGGQVIFFLGERGPARPKRKKRPEPNW